MRCCDCCGFHKGNIGAGIGRIKLAPFVDEYIGKPPVETGGGGGRGALGFDEVNGNNDPFG
jgi:hypothetical protein